jgi:predicted hotdog family 3-hydroxylacyl-ACP dehydratase
MNAQPLFESIEDLVLHSSPMLLLKSVASWNEIGLEAIVDPLDSYLFADANGAVPAWVGIEYMAQAISARSGIAARLRGEPISVGLLLGTRKYTAHVTHFAPHQTLLVKIHELLRDETNLVLFACQIYADETLVASAEVKGIEPRDLSEVITQFQHMREAAGYPHDHE